MSIAGTARTTDDLKEKETFWNPMTKAWFGDLGDGKHDGSFRDPRVTLIVVGAPRLPLIPGLRSE